jgi:hypothetical protein
MTFLKYKNYNFIFFLKQEENYKDSDGLFSPIRKPLMTHANGNKMEFRFARSNEINGMKPDFDHSEPSTALNNNPHKCSTNNAVSNERTSTTSVKNKSNEMCNEFRNIQHSVIKETIQMDIEISLAMK